MAGEYFRLGIDVRDRACNFEDPVKPARGKTEALSCGLKKRPGAFLNGRISVEPQPGYMSIAEPNSPVKPRLLCHARILDAAADHS